MTAWLTPGRQPFAGGTYFPRVQFLGALHELRAAFDAQPLQVAEKASLLTSELQRLSSTTAAEGIPDTTALRTAFEAFTASFDPMNGGFGRAPAAPTASDIPF